MLSKDVRKSLLSAAVVRSSGKLFLACPLCGREFHFKPNVVSGAAGELVLRRMVWKHYQLEHC
jgi:hypothetical protein